MLSIREWLRLRVVGKGLNGCSCNLCSCMVSGHMLPASRNCANVAWTCSTDNRHDQSCADRMLTAQRLLEPAAAALRLASWRDRKRLRMKLQKPVGCSTKKRAAQARRKKQETLFVSRWFSLFRRRRGHLRVRLELTDTLRIGQAPSPPLPLPATSLCPGTFHAPRQLSGRQPSRPPTHRGGSGAGGPPSLPGGRGGGRRRETG